MITFDEAVRLIAERVAPLGTELVTLAQAHRRVLAEPVVAAVSSPPADISSMDGYAVRDADLARLPAAVPIAGESFPGRGYQGPLPAESAVRIFTGAPVPPGADRVVIQENVRREGDRAVIEARSEARFIRTAGSDFRRGDTLVAPGTVLGPRPLVAAAAADLDRLSVHRRPLLTLLATGDELAEPGRARQASQAIPESVSFGVNALAAEWGAVPAARIRIADDLPALRDAADGALAASDLVVVTGGASVGERDFAKAMFGDRLQLVFSKVAMKPGKPVWLGCAGGTWIMGLPGNPTSAMVTARLLLAPLLCRLTGRDYCDALRWTGARLHEPLAPAGDRETFSRGRLEDGCATLLDNQDSGAQRMLAAADLLVRRPAGDRAFAAGERIDVLAF